MTGLPIEYYQSYKNRDIAYQIKGNEKHNLNLHTKITETACILSNFQKWVTLKLDVTDEATIGLTKQLYHPTY
jgi:hypothetical protein